MRVCLCACVFVCVCVGKVPTIPIGAQNNICNKYDSGFKSQKTLPIGDKIAYATNDSTI